MVIENPETILQPLRDGELMNADEFFRRYEAMPDCKKAELINGVVYMGSPVTADHGVPDRKLGVWVGTYAGYTPRLEESGNTTVMLGDDSQPQPDDLLRIIGGTSQRNERGYIDGPPELVYEIARSSLDRDLGVRREMFQRHGVQEYLIWRVDDEAFTWYSLQDGEYQELPMDDQGIIRSRVFPGLWLDTHAMIALDFRRIMITLNAGLASPEHAEFVRRLQARQD